MPAAPLAPPPAPAPRALPVQVVLKRIAWLLLGVAAMVGAGYLLAAVIFFPAPLLPSEREVPRVLGTVAEQAMLVLRKAHLRGEVVDSEPHPSLAPGQVIWQDPVPGVAVPRGSVVALTVSVGKPKVVVPDVRGLDADLAQRLLRSAGIQVGDVDSVPSEFPAGVAAGTDPSAGDSVIVGTAIKLHLGRGTK